MPIDRYPFVRHDEEDMPRPRLPIRIHNPHTGQTFDTWGMVDTGADICVLPASFAELLGHDLEAGDQSSINTSSGVGATYHHTTRIDMLEMNDNGPDLESIVYTVNDTLVAFSPGLHCVLLGVQDFLEAFVLTVDYPQQKFSIKHL